MLNLEDTKKELLSELVPVDYEGRCGNCHEYLDDTDKYCKFCGTERGKGRFEPFENDMLALYGPPIIKRYQCKYCLHKWKTIALGGGEDSKYCPQCGKKHVRLTEKKFYNYANTEDEED